MYKFQRPLTTRPEEKPTSPSQPAVVKDELVDEDEVDRATPSQSVFDPNSTSTSIWEYEYEDDYNGHPDLIPADHHVVDEFSSLPAQLAHLNNLDSVYFSHATHQHWEAEDVGDFITTLDESSSSSEDLTSMKKGKVRPKSLYNAGAAMFPRELMVIGAGPPVEKWENIMTTSCYGALTTDTLNGIGSDTHLLDISLDLSPPTMLVQIDGNTRQWMASTEELMTYNQDLESMIKRRVTVDVHPNAGNLNSSMTEDNLLSLENSYCEPQHPNTGQDLAERAESGEF